jgi:hypothetical protein
MKILKSVLFVLIAVLISSCGSTTKILNEALAKKDEVKVLRLGRKGLTEIPKEVFELGNIETLSQLNLSHSGVMLEIPESICNIHNLIQLTVDNTAILPYCIQGNVNPRFNLIIQ